jgi:hypothetical protein
MKKFLISRAPFSVSPGLFFIFIFGIIFIVMTGNDSELPPNKNTFEFRRMLRNAQ